MARLEWLLRLEPNAGEALQLAALAHDIDRAIETEKVRRADFDDYDAFKAAHARHGAKLLCPILAACGVARDIVDEACRLVEIHEVGGDPGSDLKKMPTPTKKSGFSVAPSPFNAIKLELAVILILGVFLLLAVDLITKDLVSQVLMLAGFAMGCLLWLVLRTRSISRRLSGANKAEPRMNTDKREF